MPIHELFPYLNVKNATQAIDFYQRAFDAREQFRLTEPSGRVGHAQLSFGDTTIMVADEFPELGCVGPQTIGGTSVRIHLHVDDADACIRRAVAAGATLIREPRDHFWGERGGAVRDPFGHEWLVGHSIEEGVTPEEMQRRYDALMKGA
jgi:uncharacterized glyoxalase superfamily protein PhnB